jgi:ribosomal protein L37AE/L43A
MANDAKIKDWRSTGRRKARRALYTARELFRCVDCHKTSKEPPKDAPNYFDEIWPEENRVLDYSLQADHLTKDLTVNDEGFLVWRCAKCHKESDKSTEKGESTIKKEWF